MASRCRSGRELHRCRLRTRGAFFMFRSASVFLPIVCRHGTCWFGRSLSVILCCVKRSSAVHTLTNI
ncbi:hypothetical protein ZWY2020_035493 [Hordeum vulgare]|nr:hypothetical protein ZWY2020_035493 [Hordeum vulgare]